MDIKGIEDGSNSDLMISIVDLLKRGDEEIKCCMNKELVLIIGTTGTGKSTLAQFLAGNTERLRSKPNSGGTSFTIVDEDDTISNASTILSKTIFPSIVEDRISNTLYCDCPGFSDTRSASHDIAANYFINRIVDSASSVKFLFAIHQGAVEEGYEREPFILMVKHATNFIKNLEKYKNSIALVVTKVNSYNMRGRIGDGDIVAGIAGFLRSALKDLEKEKDRPDFQIERGINFINILLEDECQKIGLFRKPGKPGRLCDFEETLQERNLLQIIILNIIRSVEPQKGDFGYTLSADSQNHVSDLVNTINREVSRDLTEVGHEIECYYSQKEDFDLEMWRAKFESLYKIFSHIQSEALKNRDTESRHYLKLLIDHVKSNDTKISEIHFENIYNKYRQLDFLNTVSERGHRVDPSCVAEGIAHVKEFFEHSSEWYSFLCRLYSILTDYTVQKNSSFNKIEQKFVLEEENVSLSEIDLDYNLNNILNYEDLAYDNIKDIILNKPKIKLLEHILNITLKDSVDIQYLTSDILIITGRYLKLSEVKCILQNNKAKCIFIMAFYKVFIDADLDETGNEIQLVIIAPTWEIIGEPRITLDGRSGEAHDPPQAAGEGESGLAGLPGGPAGIFVAIGGKFVNGQHLRLSAVGGRGGPGQVGGIGASGRDGEDPDVPGWEDIDDQKQKWREKGFNVHVVIRHIIPIIRILERELVDVTGTGGTCGGTGGDGGRGGFGGPAGQVIIINTGGSRPEFLIDCRGGEEGESGAGGPGGSGGRNGHRQRVYIHRFDVTSGHRFFERQDSPTDMGRAGDGSTGGAGLSARGLEGPLGAVVACGLGQALEVYVRLLGGSIGEGVEVCSLKGFLEQLGNNHQVNNLI